MRLTDLDRLFTDLFSSNSTMKVDIYELNQTYLMEVELPGVCKENIHLEYKDGVLTIHVDQEEQENYANVIRKERCTKNLMRSFNMPHINFKDSKANFKNGLLTINLLKEDLIDSSHLITIE